MPPEADPRLALADVEARPGSRKPDPILVMDDVSRSFGGLLAVSVDHLEIQRGTITALIGPNGAGKTTLFNLVSAFDEPTSGHWQLNGKELRGMQPYQIAREGMVRTFQLTKSLAKMTCLENMMLAAPNQSGESFLNSLIRRAGAARSARSRSGPRSSSPAST